LSFLTLLKVGGKPCYRKLEAMNTVIRFQSLISTAKAEEVFKIVLKLDQEYVEKRFKASKAREEIERIRGVYNMKSAEVNQLKSFINVT